MQTIGSQLSDWLVSWAQETSQPLPTVRDTLPPTRLYPLQQASPPNSATPYKLMKANCIHTAAFSFSLWGFLCVTVQLFPGNTVAHWSTTSGSYSLPPSPPQWLLSLEWGTPNWFTSTKWISVYNGFRINDLFCSWMTIGSLCFQQVRSTEGDNVVYVLI